MLVFGAGATFSDIMETEIAMLVPPLARAAHSVGSPQVRHTGTVGGNVAIASPAGDTLPVLSVLDAAVNLNCLRRVRSVPISKFVTGVKKTRLTKDELNTSISIPVADGPQEFRQFRLVCPDHGHHAIEPEFEFFVFRHARRSRQSLPSHGVGGCSIWSPFVRPASCTEFIVRSPCCRRTLS